MSEIINKIPLTEIISPSLNDSEYASNLEGVFSNINDNFAQLANYDFVKGERGTSVEIREMKLFDENGELTNLGVQLKRCINSLSNIQSEYDEIEVNHNDEIVKLDVFSNFTPETAGSINMIYSTVNDNEESVPVSSLYYVFLDGRYNNRYIGEIDEQQYTNIKDMSCIIVYDNSIVNTEIVDDEEIEVYGGFKSLTNAFPTIYYEKGVGLCWKINGNGTGMPVRGIPGRDGLDSTLYIVKCQSVSLNKTIYRGEVTSIFNMFDGYLPIDENELMSYDNKGALILVTGANRGFYFGTLRVIENKLYAYCDQETAINNGIDTETVINTMKQINLIDKGTNASSGIKGLFLPINNENTVQPVHILSAASITNTEGQSSDQKTDVLFTPVNDINTLNVTGDRINQNAGEGNVMIDRYLYLKIKRGAESIIFSEANTYENDVMPPIINKNVCESYNYTLKYKLVGVVKNATSGILSNSMRFGRVNNRNEGITILNTGNTKYYNTVNDNGRFTRNHYESMPKRFATRLNEIIIDNDTNYNVSELGIYRWELCNDVHDFDVDDLLSTIDDITNDKYEFPDIFNNIYTITLCPSVTSDYLWFNGLVTITNDGFGDDYNTDGVEGGMFVVPGWNGDQVEPILSFVKFVPVYDNDFRVEADTAFNINYNVNITGDTFDSKRNINVHGAINCDNLNVSGSTTSDEFKNIYTKDNIVGDRGIILARRPEQSDNIDGSQNNSEDAYLFKVDTSGNVIANNITTPHINCDDIDASDGSIYAKNSTINELNINSKDDHRRVFIGCNSDESLQIELEDINVINLRKHGVSKDEFKNSPILPVVDSDLSILQGDKTNIIVSNQTKDSDQICHYGVSSDIIDNNGKIHHGGKGVGGDEIYVDNPEFDYVKNYNIHHTLLNSGASSVISILKNPETAHDVSGNIYNYADEPEILEYTGYKLVDNAPGRECIFKKQSSDTTRGVINEFLIGKPLTDQTTIKFDRTSVIRINNPSDFVYVIGVKGDCSNGRWPCMINTSYMKLHVYYDIEGKTRQQLYNSDNVTPYELTFKFSNTTSTYQDGDASWTGYNSTGSNSLAKIYDARWRYYSYYFRPDIITINTKNPAHKEIADAFDAGKSIRIYVVPEFNIVVYGQWKGDNITGGRSSVVRGISVSNIVPANVDNGIPHPISSTVQRIGAPSKSYSYVNNRGTIEYKYIKYDSGGSSVKSTTICNDGIVTRAGDYVFGLGYVQEAVDHASCGYNTHTDDATNPTWNANEYVKNTPVLFYHKANAGYYNEDNTLKKGSKSITGYAQRMNAIPLEDIFGIIKEWREFKSEWTEFKNSDTYKATLEEKQ